MAMRTSQLLGFVASVLLASAATSGEFSETAPWRGAPDEEAIEVAMSAAQFDRQEHQTSWLGVEMVQYSGDLITYQRLINEVKPELVIETGTLSGGLSLFLATVLQAVQPEGRVVTIDIDSSGWKKTLAERQFPESLLQRIVFIEGDSAGRETWRQISPLASGKKVLVILDALHSRSHVLRELNLYSRIIPVGSYIVVNDTHLDGTEWVKSGRGPMAAVREWLEQHPEFEIARDQQPYLISAIHSGILRRVGVSAEHEREVRSAFASPDR